MNVWLLGVLGLAVAFRGAFIDRWFDSHAYWTTGHESLTYGRPPGSRDAFLYSPLFADVVHPLTLLPWPVFWAVWAALEGAVLWWLLKPLGARWWVPIWLLCTPELVTGNVFVLIAAVVVVGFVRPSLWVFPILTKVTGGVGLLWHAARGEWRKLVEAIVVLVGICGVSYLFQPREWQAWIALLASGSGDGLNGGFALAGRCAVAVVLVVVAARSAQPWLVPVALAVANPMTGWLSLTILAAIPRLRRLASGPNAAGIAATHEFRGLNGAPRFPGLAPEE